MSAAQTRWSIFLLALGATVAPSCADLTPIEAGQCGNLIIEEGEDCDGDDALGVCREPTAADACRYDCAGPDGSCPSGYVCGPNNVCLAAEECGNGVIEGDEDCDGPDDFGVCRPAGQPGACRYDCTSAECPKSYKCLEGGVCDDTDVCGNGKREPSNQEFCDPDDPNGTNICIAAGESGACQYGCPTSPDDCPEGFGCSLNNICRKPSGTFSNSEQFVGETIGLALGDLDGDGKRDVVQVTLNGFTVHFFGAQARREAFTSLAATATPPVIGDLTNDGRDDIAFRTPSKFLNKGGELAAFASQASPERTLAPLTQATENLPGYAVALDILQPAINADLLFLDVNERDGLAQGYSFEADIGTNTVSFGLTAELNTSMNPSFGGAVLGHAVADFKPDTMAPCDEVAFAWRGAGEVRVFTPCIVPQGDTNWNTVIPPVAVDLPDSQVVFDSSGTGANAGGAVFAAFVDGDAQPDLVIPTSDPTPPTCAPAQPTCTNVNPVACECHGCASSGTCGVDLDCVCPACANQVSCNVFNCNLNGVCDPQSEGCNCPDCAKHTQCAGPDSLQVAYGLTDGSFSSTTPAVGPGDNRTSSLTVVANANFQCPTQLGPLGDAILGVADFNGDGKIDIVSGYGVYISSSVPGRLDYNYCPPERWTEAVIGDFDGNGTLDVVASSGGTTLDFVIGGGNGTFSSKLILAGGFARGLVSADFDGDTLNDVGFLRTDLRPMSGQTEVQYAIAVAFGRPSAAPTPPLVVGETLDAERIVAGRMLLGDGAADLFVQRGSNNAVLLHGDVTRQFVSTLVFRTQAPGAYATHDQVTSMEALVYGKFREGNAVTDHDFVLASLTSQPQQQPLVSLPRVELVSSRDNGTGVTLKQWANEKFDCVDPPCDAWRLAAVDLESTGTDNLVAFRDDEIRIFSKQEKPTQIGLVANTEISLLDNPDRGAVYSAMVGAPMTVDVNADGLKDVAILSSRGDIHVFWNDGTGQLSSERSTMLEATTTSVDDAHPRAFTFIQASGDATLELVVVTNKDARLHLYDSEADAFSTPVVLPDVPPGDMVVAGDLDGDGVEDLVVGDALSFTVMKGVPAGP